MTTAAHPTTAPAVHLRAADTSLVLRLDGHTLPTVRHWGPDLGDVGDEELAEMLLATSGPVTDSDVYMQDAVSLLPQHSSGWLGRPGVWGSRAGRAWSVAFASVTHHVETLTGEDGPELAGGTRVRSTGLDGVHGLEVGTELELLPGGLLRVRGWVRNLAAEVFEVGGVEPALPVPGEARELLDMAGRHAHERVPQRRPFDVGAWVREARGGRPGHDAATVLAAGVPGFGFRSGRVYGVHLGWSGNQVQAAEHSYNGWRLLRGGELLGPGEIRLGRDETYRSPWLYASWGDGLDALSARFHEHLRARATHPRSPRPVLLNVWEAVYFDHDLEKLTALADHAAALGVERFVLDDGWFPARRDDTAGLGDWVVDRTVWPDGLTPLVDHVRSLGMDFGLWFEPEMVHLDSNLARTHPEWLMGTEHGPGPASRHQHVLDLGHPEAYAHVLGQISALVAEYAIDFIKWDHNRPLVDAGHGPAYTPGVHLQTRAVYRMMDELKRRHPGLEIESCCGGGGRVDLGVLERTDRVWVSDCIDAHERHRMVRWTGLTLPPELMGTHVGAGRDHTTGRMHTLGFRAGTAIWGHLGLEWDLTKATPAELEELGRWIALHKRFRGLLHSGVVVRADLPNPAMQLEGVVAQDGGQALFRLSALDYSTAWPPGQVPLPGLDPARRYRLTTVAPADTTRRDPAPWMHHRVVLNGRILAEVGVEVPLFDADELLILHLEAV